MKRAKRFISLLVMAVFVFSLASPVFAGEVLKTTTTEDGRVQVTFEFPDSQEAAWAIEYIAEMQSKDIFKGYEDGTFRPNKHVSRVEAIVMAVRLMGLEEEAKSVSLDTTLNFKDANLINQKFAWAKGYILVALENGLFDASEDQIQPDKPATRVWVSSLLVRALGLEEEALEQMLTVPDFKDAASIPAGAIGYVNVALDHGIVTGYPDNTFKPNKNVTRAEIAALLERTNDGLLEESGAVTYMGKVTSLSFEGTEIAAVIGKITVETFNGNSVTFDISSNLLVKYGKRFIPANQLLVDDVVSVVAKDGVVVEASLVNEENLNESTLGIREFKFEVEMDEDQEFSIKYENKEGKVKAELKRESDDSEEKLEGREAVAAVESFLTKLAISPDLSNEEIYLAVMEEFQITEEGFDNLELEIKFANGKKVEIEIED